MEETNETVYKSLRPFNILMAIFHAAQGVLMLALSTDFSIPVITTFVEYSPESQKLAPVLASPFSLPIGQLVAGFLFLSGIAHAVISLPRVYGWYLRTLKSGANFARWMEYSLSSSLMIVVVSLLVGITDALTLLLMFFLNMAMILFGWMMELHNQSTTKVNWTSYWFGVLAGAIPWVAIAISLFSAGSGDAKAPTFVYWIFLSIFLFFNCFAINMALQYAKIGKWKSYVYGERVYILLSLVAKSLLAWQVWAGTLRPV